MYDENCPRSFYKRYVEESMPENDTVEWYAQYGSLLHKITEDYEKSHGFMSKEMLIRQYNEGFSHITIPQNQRDIYYQQGYDYMKRLSKMDTSNIIGVEWEFLLHLYDDMPPIKGFIDKLEIKNNEYIVYDFKSSKPYTKGKVANSLQFGIYGLAVLQEFKKIPIKYRYEYIRFDQFAETTRTRQEMEDTKKRIYEIWKHIKNEEFEPRYNQFYCQNFCAYNTTCSLYQSKPNKKWY